MTDSTDTATHAVLSPDEAFSVLGNETRVRILRTLGEAETALSFTELRDRVGIRQGAQFNYHLDKVVGHFVRKSDDGYALRQPGRRVVQAILSGAMTDDPVLEPTEVDFACRHCGAPVEVSYGQGETKLSCTECRGNYRESVIRERDDGAEYGNLTHLSLPPAGVHGRTATGVLRAAATVGHLDAMAAVNDICPRCSAPVDHSVSICEDHDTTGDLCDRCGYHLAVHVDFRCTNCIYEQTFAAVMGLLDAPALLAFVGEHGLNVTADGIEWGWDYGEEILSVDPFEARFTFTIEGDSITLTVDDELEVVEATRQE